MCVAADFIHPPSFITVYQRMFFIAKSGTANVAVPLSFLLTEFLVGCRFICFAVIGGSRFEFTGSRFRISLNQGFAAALYAFR